MTPDLALPLLLALPLGTSAVSLLLARRLTAQRLVSVGVLAAMLVLAGWTLVAVWDGSVHSVAVGGHDAVVGIVLVADPLAALMLVVSTLMLVTVMVYAIGSTRTRDTAPVFHPIYLVLAAGVMASFLTGDLFNLFVSFEVMLTASYVLITLGGSADQVRHGMTYVVIGLLASTLFITAVGLVYAATGTVNMADLAGTLDQVDPQVRTALGLLLLVVFGVKAAIFPLFQWLPDSYPTAPSPVTALFAGLLTKVGVYAIIRTQTLMFPTGGTTSTVLLVLAGLTMFVGVLGAIAQDDIKRLLSFHIVSQIGYMLFGLGLFSLAGLAGAVLFLANQVLVKTTLFLVGGIIEETTGTGLLRRLGGMVHGAPLLAALFLLPALSLAGLPPLPGFVAKLALVQAGLGVEEFLWTGVALGVSLLTLFSMTKIWNGVFWGTPDEPSPKAEEDPGGRWTTPRLMTWSTGVLVAVSLGVVVVAGPLYGLSERAATILLEPGDYVEAVMER